VLLLRVHQGLSCEDVATALGWSVAKVKIEVFRARQALRAAAFGGDDE
jgi:DNA-directed RNA polymerase specialized sigma24 family protein